MEKGAQINWPLFVYCISLIASFNIRVGCVVKFRTSFKDYQSITHNDRLNLSLRITSFSVTERLCFCIREVPVWNLGRFRIAVPDLLSSFTLYMNARKIHLNRQSLTIFTLGVR
jgi:hypothetical protein